MNDKNKLERGWSAKKTEKLKVKKGQRKSKNLK